MTSLRLLEFQFSRPIFGENFMDYVIFTGFTGYFFFTIFTG
jgi:hypothetical protein